MSKPMKRFLVIFFTVVFAYGIFDALFLADSAEKSKSQETTKKTKKTEKSNSNFSHISYDQVWDKFGPDSNLNESEKEEVWNRLKGKCVQWRGIIESKSKNWSEGWTVYVQHLDSTLTYDVAVNFSKDELYKAKNLDPGEEISYKGILTQHPTATTSAQVDSSGC